MVLEVGFVYYKAYKLFGMLYSDLGCVGVLGCLGCCARLLACSMGVSECAASGVLSNTDRPRGAARGAAAGAVSCCLLC